MYVKEKLGPKLDNCRTPTFLGKKKDEPRSETKGVTSQIE